MILKPFLIFIRGRVTKIIQITRKVDRERFVDMIDEEVKEHTEEHQKALMNEELEEIQIIIR